MKKLFAVILCLMLPAVCFAQTLTAGATAPAAIAAKLAEQCGLTFTAAESAEAAANAALAEPGTLCLSTQQMLIRGLQGYMDGDPRTDLQALTVVARDDVFLVMQQEAAAALDITDLASFMAYVTDNEYAVTVMRWLDANAYDRACCTLMDELYVESDVYFDLEDMVSSCDGETPYVLLMGAADAKKLAEQGFAVLGCLSDERSPYFPDVQCAAEAGAPVCQGEWYGVFAAAGADVTDAAGQIGAALAAHALDETLDSLYLQAASADDFQSFVLEQAADLAAYMTAEGLFFYEE